MCEVLASLALEAIGIWSQKVLCMEWLIFICRPAWAGPIFTANFSQTLTWNHEEEEEEEKNVPTVISKQGGNPASWSLYTTSQEAGGGVPQHQPAQVLAL